MLPIEWKGAILAVTTPQIELKGRCQSNGGSSTCSATATRSGDLCREGAPLGQGSRASLLVDLPRDEMALLIELVVHLGVN